MDRITFENLNGCTYYLPYIFISICFASAQGNFHSNHLARRKQKTKKRGKKYKHFLHFASLSALVILVVKKPGLCKLRLWYASMRFSRTDALVAKQPFIHFMKRKEISFGLRY